MKMKNRLWAILFVMTVLPLQAQKNFTLSNLLSGGGKEFWDLQPRNLAIEWWGQTPVLLDEKELKEACTGKVLATYQQLNEWVGETLTYDSRYVCFPYPEKPLMDYRRDGRHLQVDFSTGQVTMDVRLLQDAENEDFCAASGWTAFTRQGNLYVMSGADKTPVQVTTDGSTDGSDDIVYGQSAHRNEFGIEKGTFWSPDGTQLAFYRIDQSKVPSYPQVDITTRISTTYTDKYPMAGEASQQVSVGVYNVQSKKTVYLKLIGGPEDYHTNLSWSPDGKTLYVFELNRDQNDMRLVAYDTATGEPAEPLLQETSSRYVEPLHGLDFLPWDHEKAVMQSQRDGFNHLYLLDIKTGATRQLTSGNWVVQEFVGFCERDKSLIYLSNESDPRHSCLYRLQVKTGKKRLLGLADGVHDAKLNADGSRLIDRYSSPTVPRSINLIDTKNGRVENLLTAADPWQENGYDIPEITSGSIKAADGKTDLYYRMVKPIHFDPTRKYPVVIYVYGGPHAHNVDARWHWNLRGWEAYMAQKGFLLFILDNRGSEWRGRDFEQATYRHLGEVEMQDQIEGVKYLKSLPYVDADRMGVHGWSFGGFMTTNLMCSYPDVFKVGVAGGPVIDWKYYEVMYGERYMSTPQKNPDGYQQSSLLNKAANLKGRLQIIYGYNDPTCVPQHTLSFIRACIKAGTQPDLFTYPGAEHNMRGSEQIHLHERITRYFEDHL